MLRVSTIVLVNSLKKAPSCSVFMYPWSGIIFITVRAGADNGGGAEWEPYRSGGSLKDPLRGFVYLVDIVQERWMMVGEYYLETHHEMTLKRKWKSDKSPKLCKPNCCHLLMRQSRSDSMYHNAVWLYNSLRQSLKLSYVFATLLNSGITSQYSATLALT